MNEAANRWLVFADDYYIPTRYPDALPGMLPEGLPGEDEARKAVALARVVLERIQRLTKFGKTGGG